MSIFPFKFISSIYLRLPEEEIVYPRCVYSLPALHQEKGKVHIKISDGAGSEAVIKKLEEVLGSRS